MSSFFDWTETTIARLRHLWAGPDSTIAIGVKLGVSKNAVVGKAHRIGLPSRPSPIERRLAAPAGKSRRARRIVPEPKNSLPRLASLPAAPASPAAPIAAPVAAQAPAVSLVRPDPPRAVETPPLIVYAPGGRGCEAVLQPWRPGMDPRDVYCSKPRRDRGCSYCPTHAAVFLTGRLMRASTMASAVAAAEWARPIPSAASPRRSTCCAPSR